MAFEVVCMITWWCLWRCNVLLCTYESQGLNMNTYQEI